MGGRVPAFLVTPLGKGRFAGVVLMHRGFGDRSSMLDEALLYARAGAVCVLPDGFPRNRPERPATDFSTAEGVRDALVQIVIDLRRAIDILFSRLDVSSSRIGYVGHSLGATVGGALAGPCERVSAYVLMDGYPQVSLKIDSSRKNSPAAKVSSPSSTLSATSAAPRPPRYSFNLRAAANSSPTRWRSNGSRPPKIPKI